MLTDKDDPRSFLGKWFVIAVRTVRSAWRDDFGIAASSIAFAAFLALIPLGGLAASSIGDFVDPTILEDRIDTLNAIIPADARQIIHRVLNTNVADDRGNFGSTVTFVVIALLSARRAGSSLLYGINLAYRVDRQRSALRRHVVSILLVLGCASLVLAGLLSVSVLAFLRTLLPDSPMGDWLTSNFVLFGALTIGSGGALILIYRYAPATDPIAWRNALPGAVAGVVGWLGATLVFRFYVTWIARFDDIYGALSAVVVLMFWLLVSAWVLMLGARINAEAMRSTAGRPTKDKP